ncbi:PREDICTED: open rectifier potassium channel protein 1 [Dinoponera quadriceps]|uniref:Open rectifier potassium channel protein 1 n=1 Tax=Dinoponera quadriceps TaxID=609295 RepID=A0A6P3X8H7_DINQU|nr:PREDICTED: open rectifier potassium channel protein 1 [Dinoponera quadriceps]
MSKKQWLVLLMLFLTYLLLGASIFYHIEGREEIEKIEKAKLERIQINALLHKHYIPSPRHNQTEILDKLTEYCEKSVFNYTEGEEDRKRWDFYNSFYFAYTVVSTIGYGNLAPTNTLSRILMIFYGLVGIPMNGILLTQLGDFFSQVFIRAHRKYKSYKQSQANYSPKKTTHLETRKVGLAAQIFMYLTPGFVMFIFFPAFLFSYYEGWTYDQAVYYAFVTLTTIGFGDIVAGQDNTKGSGPLFIMYKTFLICWISFGLGYIVMIMTFIARGMRSKKITRLEHRLAMNLKHTQSRIWNEFNKEVNYLRRVFNELQLSKVKRVYVDEYDYEVPLAKLSRSNSFPDLRTLVIGGFTEDHTPPRPRRRANSEVVPADELTRVVSETDLQRIDKTATFAAHAMVQPAELLARLVNILGYIPPPPDDMNDWEQDEDHQSAQADVSSNDQFKTADSYNSTKQGLPKVSQWRIGGERFPFTKPRSRATSEVRLHVTKNDFNQENSEWTWSGPTASKKLQELMKARDTTPLPTSKDSGGKYRFPSFAATKNLFPRWRRQSKRTSVTAKSTDKAVVENNEKSSQQSSTGPLPPMYLDDRRDSTAKNYYTHDGSNLSNYLEGNTLLEETSLADFLRALTALHTRVGTVPDEYVAKPKRKLGTASLTPPKLPSLFTLFSSGSAAQSNQNTVTGTQSYQSSRRVSLRTADSTHTTGSNTPAFFRRESAPVKPRRFSLRPVATPVSPPTPPDYGPPRLPNLHPLTLRVDERNLQEPYASTEAFLSVSPKEPLVTMEGPPGISSPMKPASGIRRFSIRPAQLSAQTSPTNTITPSLHTPKQLSKWKAGILQRQLGQMNLQRRVRAFSLSDVNSSRREKSPTPVSPLAIDNSNKSQLANKLVDVSRVNQKTVTIMSPAEELSMTSKSEPRSTAIPPAPAASREEQVSSWRSRENAASSVNPFASGISDESKQTAATSRVDGGRRCQEDGTRYGTTSSGDRSVLGDLNDRPLGRTVQTGVRKTNVDVKAKVPSLGTEKQSDACVTDHSREPRDNPSNATSSTSARPDSRWQKPSVSINFYKPSRQVVIEKPAVDPFEQYRAMTRKSSRKEDADLEEVKVECSHAKRDETDK